MTEEKWISGFFFNKKFFKDFSKIVSFIEKEAPKKIPFNSKWESNMTFCLSEKIGWKSIMERNKLWNFYNNNYKENI